ncbi:RloB family protein [Haliangium sp. UPWRP_2]|uniref:RloB family protein n=1 Tax=Haliangium sp. UPWRP_2 TaxID=1931276 RepID=UPI000B546C13|nr:RloB family protein [Haliangium sp. UPWRP_2]PSM31658.1 hypothetical protein BVG81_004235 [Haliangium sp. UPWRP_2]
MADDCDYDRDWWRAPMADSLARKRARIARSALAQPGDAFLIVTEGTVTEPHYFDRLRGLLSLKAIHIRIEPGEASDPRRLIEQAAAFVRDHARRAKRDALRIDEPQRYDHVFAVIDTDVAQRQGHWNDIVQLAQARHVQLAHSSPCFEYWLLLHIAYSTRTDLVDGPAAKHAVKQAIDCDYAKSADTLRAAIDGLVDKWPQAVVHAERVAEHHARAGTPIPANPSTEVGRLVRALNDAAPSHARKL